MPDKPCARNHPCPACGYADVRDLRAMQELGGGCPMLEAICRRCGYVEMWPPLGMTEKGGPGQELVQMAQDLDRREKAGEIRVEEVSPGCDGRGLFLMVRWAEVKVKP